MYTEWPNGSVDTKIPDTIKRPDETTPTETGKNYIEKLLQGVRDQLAVLKWELKTIKQPDVSSKPGENVGERPDVTGANSGPQGTAGELISDAVGISTPSVQTLNIGDIPHTTTPTNIPYDPFK